MTIAGRKFSDFPEAADGEVVVVGLQDGQNVKVRLNTETVVTKPDVIYRDAQGRFKSKVNLPKLANSLENFRFIANVLDDHEAQIQTVTGDLARLEDVLNEFYKQVGNELPGESVELPGYDDAELRHLIAEEEAARVEGDEALGKRIDNLVLQGPDTIYDDTEVWQAIRNEEGARAAENLAIHHLIAVEAEAREDADKAIIDAIEGYNPDVSELTQKLDKEISDREKGDDALGELISNNAKEIETNSTTLDGHSKQLKDLWFANNEQKEQISDLDSRVTDLENAEPPEAGGPAYDDTEIKAELAQEVEDRIDGDAALQKDVVRIDEAISTHEKEVSDLWDQNAWQNRKLDELDKAIEDIDVPEPAPPYDDTELTERVAAEEKARAEGDELLQNQINKITADLEAIEELVEHHLYTIVSGTPGDGEARFGNPGGTYWAQGALYLGPTDMLGHDTTMPYQAGDVLRFEEPDAYDFAQVTVSSVDQSGLRVDFYVNAAQGEPSVGEHIRIVMVSDEAGAGGEMDWDTADERYALKKHSHPAYAAESHTHPEYADEDHDHDGYLKADGSVKAVSSIQAPTFDTGTIRFHPDYQYPSIVENTATRIEFEKRTIIRKGDVLDAVGLEIRGKTAAGSNKNLLEAYHVRSGIDSIRYYGTQAADEDIATVGYVTEALSGGGAETLHLMGKGQWGRSETDVATDKFIATKFDGTAYNTLNQYVFGIMVAQSYAGQTTRNFTWQQGAYLEVFDSTGLCIFASQIDSSELSSRNYLHLKWRDAPKFYVNKTLSYGTAVMLKVHGLTAA